MLQSLVGITSSFFVKILMALLVASFAFWGIGDVFRGGSSNTVMKVGDGTIGAQEFYNAMQRETMEYRRMLGAQYKPEMLKTLGIPQQVLRRLVEQKLVEQETSELGIMVPASHIKSEIRNNPMFQNDDGTFSARQFKMVLMNNNLNEAMYVSLLEQEVAANMLLQSAFSGTRVTDEAARRVYLHETEQRIADLLIFPASLVTEVGEPSQAELERYYEANSQNFRANELRIFSLVTLDPATLAKEMTVSDDDLMIEYQARINEYREPERRDVRQLLFSDEEAAKRASAALQDGKGMEEVAREFGALNTTLQLGTVTASGVIPEAEQAVFSLEKDAYSQPIRSNFGWHIFHVVDIQPERTRPLIEVREELLESIRASRIGEEAYALSNTLQDDLAAGASLEDAARGVGATVKVYGPVTRDGEAPDGTRITLPANHEQLLAQAFSTEEGMATGLQETDDGTYYALRVDSVQPERVRALDEIRGMVIQQWKTSQKAEKLYQLATASSADIQHSSIGAVAASSGATLVRGQNFSRSTSEITGGKAIPAMMLTAVFAAGKGTPTEAFLLQDGSYVVAQVTDIRKADPDSEEGRAGIERTRENLRIVYGDEIYRQYMTYLQQKHRVSEPNMALIDSLIQ